jgi:hypothetical protein
MSHKRHLISIVVCAVALAIVTFALVNRPLRIWYHRKCLRGDMLFTPVGPKSIADHSSLSYWKWRLLERRRTAEQQLQRRQEIDAPRQISALVALGYFAHREFALSDPMESFPSRPLWLQKLSAKSLNEVRTKKVDWPDIRFVASTSNTILIHVTGPLPLLQEWETAIHDHEAHH